MKRTEVIIRDTFGHEVNKKHVLEVAHDPKFNVRVFAHHRTCAGRSYVVSITEMIDGLAYHVGLYTVYVLLNKNSKYYGD